MAERNVLDRRTFVKGMLAAGATVTVAACVPSATPTATPAPTPTPTPVWPTGWALRQIGMAVKDLDAAVARYSKYPQAWFAPETLLDSGPWRYTTGERFPAYLDGKAADVKVRIRMMYWADIPIPFELFQTIEGKWAGTRFLDEVGGDGINHLGFEVDDALAEANRLIAAGAKEVVRFGDAAIAPPSMVYVDLDPELKGPGLMIEFFQRNPVRRASAATPTPTSAPTATPPTPTRPTGWVLGQVGMAVKDLDAAVARYSKYPFTWFSPETLLDTVPWVYGSGAHKGERFPSYIDGKLQDVKLRIRSMYWGGCPIPFELFQTIEGEWAGTRFLAENGGDGINHVLIRVDDALAEANKLIAVGAKEVVKFGDPAKESPSLVYVDLDPQLKGPGLMLELIKRNAVGRAATPTPTTTPTPTR